MEIKRGRGRPKGCKGKTKEIQRQDNAGHINTKDIKHQIRMLRKIKKDTHKKTAERRELNEKIRSLKKLLRPVEIIISPEKADIIGKILERRPDYTTLGMNLNIYTLEQLNFHYDRILNKTR